MKSTVGDRRKYGTKAAGDAGAAGQQGQGQGNAGAAAAAAAAGAAAGAAAAAAQGGAGAGAAGAKSNEIEGAELQAIIAKAVADGLKGFPSLTEDKIAAIVKAVISEREAEGHELNVAAVTEVASKATQAAIASLRKPAGKAAAVGSAAAGDAGEGAGAGQGAGEGRRIERTIAWTKGNLPLHAMQLKNVLQRKPMNEGIDDSMLRDGLAKGEATYHRLRKTYGSKAITSTGAGTGDELVDTDLSSELQRRLYLESVLYAALAANEIDMPSQPFEFPLSTTRAKFYYESTEATAATESTPGTGKVILDAKKFMSKVLFSYESDEDAIIAILPWLQQNLGEAAAADFESVIINGDTTATHQDSDTHAIAKAAEKSLDGFRKLALANAATKLDISTGGISAANWRALKKKMKKYGKATSDLLTIVGVLGENDILGLTEVQTVDKVGPRAAILTGTVASIYNSPIITSEQAREDLNASGVYDGSTTTKGSILLVNRTRFIMGRRREFTIETDKDIDTQQTKVVASFRRALKPIETPSATVPSLAIGYNYTA